MCHKLILIDHDPWQRECGASWKYSCWESKGHSNLSWFYDILLNVRWVAIIHLQLFSGWHLHCTINIFIVQENLELYLHQYPSPFLQQCTVFCLALWVSITTSPMAEFKHLFSFYLSPFMTVFSFCSFCGAIILAVH